MNDKKKKNTSLYHYIVTMLIPYNGVPLHVTGQQTEVRVVYMTTVLPRATGPD